MTSTLPIVTDHWYDFGQDLLWVGLEAQLFESCGLFRNVCNESVTGMGGDWKKEKICF